MPSSSSLLPSKSSSPKLALLLGSLLSSPFLLSLLLVRLPLALLQRTPFQPDETYQSLEPAHRIVFGYGHLTWEWRPNEAVQGVSWGWMAEGRLRGSAWVALWAGVYWVVKTLRIESWGLTIAPKVVIALIASLCDSSTYNLARRIYGHSVAPTALLLSLTSLFHAHALTRPFTNSVETSLTIYALTWWPLRSDTPSARSASTCSERSSTRIALLIAAITFTLRPTNLVLWIFLGAHLVYSRWTHGRKTEARQVVWDAFWIGILTLVPSTLLDTLLFPPPPNSTLPFTFPLLPFLTYNLLLPTSLFYGSNPWHYYLLQAMPILLLPSLPLALPAFGSAARGGLGRDGRVLAGLIAWGVGVYSLIGHKEWRFCHPVVPVWNVLTAGWVMQPGRGREWVVGGGRGGDGKKEGKGGLRLPRKSWTLLLIFVPLGPVIYLSRYHGVAQHGVIDWLRANGEVKSVGVLMPCHSTPWQSQLHREDLDGRSWFLTCDPPKSLLSHPSTPHQTPESLFYSSPTRYLRLNFPSTYSPPEKSFASLQRMVPNLLRWPSHLVLFGALLDGPEGREVETLLKGKGYEEVWRAWNGFDVLQDDERRRGGVRVWAHVEPGGEE